MNVIVCVNRSPTRHRRCSIRDHTLKRDGKLILDESDSYGVEMPALVGVAGEAGEHHLDGAHGEMSACARACDGRRQGCARLRSDSPGPTRDHGQGLAAAVQRLGGATS